MTLNPVTVYPVTATYVAQQLNTYTDMADVLDYLRTLGYTGTIQLDSTGAYHLYFQIPSQTASWNASAGDWVVVQNGAHAASVPAAQAGGLYTATPPVTFSATPPTATAGTAGKASFVFPDPTGPNAPYTGAISAQYSTNNGASWTAATLDSPGVTESAGNTTVHLTGLPAGAKVFRAAVTVGGMLVYGPASTSVTTT